LLENNEEYIEKFSSGTSVQVFNREYYLTRGGNYEIFEGWGYEDMEFTTRLAHKSKKFPLPRNFEQDYKNFKDIVEYKGFKSIGRLYGDISLSKGIVLFHAWHEVNHDSEYMQLKANNRIMFENVIANYLQTGHEPDPLPDISSGNSLIFGNNHPAIFNREILPRLGKLFVEDEMKFADISLLNKFIKENNITRTILPNPYANETRLKIYHYLREHNLPYFIIERGALPDSIFFDPNGFNADSSSYKPANWDFELTSEKRLKVEQYVNEELTNDAALEIQPERIDLTHLKRELGIKPKQKILFVPFQTVSDTVIKYFCGNDVKTYQEFLDLVQEVALNLPDDWRIIGKKHPLSKEIPILEKVIYVDDYNIKDLLDIADCILIINSGVGVLSMLRSKPVLYTGEVFYAHDLINKKVKSCDEIIQNLKDLFVPDKEKIYRFLSFLINDFYCFGKFTTKVVDWSKESNMTVTTKIDFYQINNIGKTKYLIDPDREFKIGMKSIMFDRYRFDLEYAKSHKAGDANSINRPKAANKKQAKNLLVKRINKMFRDPYRFFNDSRFIFLRPFKYLFK